MSTPNNNGGPAFPRAASHSQAGGTHHGYVGMTLRDYFAGQAVGELIREQSEIERDEQKYGGEKLTAGSLPYFGDCIGFDCPAGKIAFSAYDIADAMLAVRERKEGAQ